MIGWLRYLYVGIFYLSLPFLWLRLFWRGRKEASYRCRWRERMGHLPSMPAHLYQKKKSGGRVIWLHAVSVGEVRASVPLVEALCSLYEDDIVLVTCTTPTGSAQVKACFSDTVWHSYLPYDIPSAIRRFYKKASPQLLVIMETELWPYLIHFMKKKSVPILLANARLSSKSACRYLKIKHFIRTFIQDIDQVAAQSTQDAIRFAALGVFPQQLMIAGNLKYHLHVSDQLTAEAAEFNKKTKFLTASWCWVAGSVHADKDLTELEALIASHVKLLEKDSSCKLILVPRHLRHLQNYEDSLTKAGLSYVKRSELHSEENDPQVLLVDTMGELLLFYALAEVAFVGGSLVDVGGHNLLEPAAFKKPVISGSYLYNQAAMSQQMLAKQALIVIDNQGQLEERLQYLFLHRQEAQAIGQRGYEVLQQHQGALQRHLQWIAKVFPV